MTSEAKLKAIISAQVKGGHKTWKYLIDDDMYMQDKNGLIVFNLEGISPLEILLDTQGCKAAYGEEIIAINDMIEADEDKGLYYMITAPRFHHCSRIILDAWHSKEGNNWKQAINVAYDLLPKDE